MRKKTSKSLFQREYNSWRSMSRLSAIHLTGTQTRRAIMNQVTEEGFDAIRKRAREVLG